MSRRQALAILVVLAFAVPYWLSAEAVRAAVAEHEVIELHQTAIEHGLGIRVKGRNLLIAPGKCWINDRQAVFPHEQVIEVPPCPDLPVNDTVEICTNNGKNLVECMLPRCVAGGKGGEPVEGVFVPGSLLLRSASKNARHEKGIILQPGSDYVADTRWGIISRLDKGRLAEHEPVVADYKVARRRVDTLVITPAGHIKLVEGPIASFAPDPPRIDDGSIILAHVSAPPRTASVARSDVLPVYGVGIKIDKERQKKNNLAIARTVRKLKAGKPVSIVFWGDSVTVGAFSSTPEKSFARLTVSALQKAYPSATITATNLGLGGTTSLERQPLYESNAVGSKPDLLVIEFVNDLKLPPLPLQPNFHAMIARAKANDVEVIVCTPHLLLPKYLKLSSWEAVAHMPHIRIVRSLGDSGEVAVADVSNRWEHAYREGLKPEMLLSDAFLHPNDLGHRIYAEEILKCFPGLKPDFGN